MIIYSQKQFDIIKKNNSRSKDFVFYIKGLKKRNKYCSRCNQNPRHGFRNDMCSFQNDHLRFLLMALESLYSFCNCPEESFNELFSTSVNLKEDCFYLKR